MECDVNDRRHCKNGAEAFVSVRKITAAVSFFRMSVNTSLQRSLKIIVKMRKARRKQCELSCLLALKCLCYHVGVCVTCWYIVLRRKNYFLKSDKSGRNSLSINLEETFRYNLGCVSDVIGIYLIRLLRDFILLRVGENCWKVPLKFRY